MNQVIAELVIPKNNCGCLRRIEWSVASKAALRSMKRRMVMETVRDNEEVTGDFL